MIIAENNESHKLLKRHIIVIENDYVEHIDNDLLNTTKTNAEQCSVAKYLIFYLIYIKTLNKIFKI